MVQLGTIFGGCSSVSAGPSSQLRRVQAPAGAQASTTQTWSQSNPEPLGCSAALTQQVRTVMVHPTSTTDPTVPANGNSSEEAPLGNKISFCLSLFTIRQGMSPGHAHHNREFAARPPASSPPGSARQSVLPFGSAARGRYCFGPRIAHIHSVLSSTWNTGWKGCARAGRTSCWATEGANPLVSLGSTPGGGSL